MKTAASDLLFRCLGRTALVSTLAALAVAASAGQALAQAVGSLADGLRRADADHLAGRYADEQTLLRGLLAGAPPTGDAATDIELRLAESFDLSEDIANEETAARKALSVAQASGAPPARLAEAKEAVAVALNEAGQFTAAEPIHREALALALAKPLGANTELTASILDGLGRNLAFEGRYADAEPPLRRALAIRAVIEPQSLQTARSDLSLGILLLDTAQNDKAETLLRQALALRIALLPPHHPLIASAERLLGQALSEEKKYAEAEPIERAALAEIDAALGPEVTPSVAAAEALASTLEAEKRYGEAEALRRRVVATEQKAADDMPSIAGANQGLANNLQLQSHLTDAEALFRAAVAIRQKVQGEQNSDTALAEGNLAANLYLQTRYADAEPLYRQVLATNVALKGENDPSSLSAMGWLADDLAKENKVPDAMTLWAKDVDGRLTVEGREAADTLAAEDSFALFLTTHYYAADAEKIARSTLTIRERLFGADSYEVGLSLNQLADALDVEGRYVEAADMARRQLSIDTKIDGAESGDTESDWHQLSASLYFANDIDGSLDAAHHALAIARKIDGENSDVTAGELKLIAGDLTRQGRKDEAFPAAEENLAIEVHINGMKGPQVSAGLGTLAGATVDTASIVAIRRQIVAIDAAYYGEGDNAVGSDISELGDALKNNGDKAGAEKAYLESLTRDTFNLDTMIHLGDLASLLDDEGRYADAEPYARRAVALNSALTMQRQVDGYYSSYLARSLAGQGKTDEAEPVWREAIKSDDALLRAEFGAFLLDRDKTAEAVSELRLAVSGIEAEESKALQGNDSYSKADWSRDASASLSLALRCWAAEGGGAAAGDRPDALTAEAFLAAQNADKDSEGDVFARAGARLSAGALGLGDVVTQREKLIGERASLQQRFAEMAGQANVSKTDLDALSVRLAALDPRVDAVNAQLRAQFPSYWALINPDPVPIDQLQGAGGAGPALLHADEALIVFMAPPSDSETGLVFAVSREKTGWAAIDLTGEELRKRVGALRTDIDPFGYGVDSGARRAPPRANIFDRTASYALYKALLGAPSIQAVIADKATLLFVPSGPLNSLPPGLLVTAPPEGGRAMDDDPEALRNTHWLLREKAVAVLPNVASLRLLRQSLPKARPRAMSPLLAFADPDFASESGPSPAAAKLPMSFELTLVSRDDRGRALADLEPLPGTRAEGEALRRALNAQPDSLLLGDQASRAELFRRNDDGRLAKVRILSFSTHGLVAGDLGLTEPALVLSGDGHGHDGLLTASDTAALRLGADWVILSACNTASPDPRHTEGVSGLARAFFYAGARALIVSHWRVRDDVASRLIPDVVSRQRSGMSRAQAMREASLAILDDKALDAADPFSWAPFVVMGDPGD